MRFYDIILPSCSDGGFMSVNTKDFWFLKRILPLTHWQFMFLISVDEFSSRLSKEIDDGVPINEREIYQIIRDIYDSQINQQKETGAYSEWFNKNAVKSIVRSLWVDITGLQPKLWNTAPGIQEGVGTNPTLYKDDILNENGKIQKIVGDLSFLYRALPLRGVEVNEWIFDDDFATEIEALIKDGFRIDSRTVFLIMRRIYLEKEKKREENPQKFDNFDFKIARSGIVSLWENLTGSREGWRDGEI